MKHEKRASESTLAKIEQLLGDLRTIDALQEKRPGVFYLGREELIHFHELPDSIVADVFLPGKRLRLPVTTRSEQLEVLDRIWGSVENRKQRSSRQRKKN